MMNEINNVPRMRTIPQAYALLKEVDPDTSVSMRGLRKIISSGDIPTVKINNKVLINFDFLLRYLSCYNNSATGANCIEREVMH